MRIRVLLFGQLKDIVGRQEELLELEPGSRLSSVMAHYAGWYPGFQGLANSIACSINQEYAPVTAALGFIRDGKLTALTVSSAQRSLALPDVPTSLEAGYPNSDFNFWIGVFAPAGTPAAIVEKLNREIGKALRVPAVREKLAVQGVDPMEMDTATFGRFVKDEVASATELAKALDLKPN